MRAIVFHFQSTIVYSIRSTPYTLEEERKCHGLHIQLKRCRKFSVYENWLLSSKSKSLTRHRVQAKNLKMCKKRKKISKWVNFRLSGCTYCSTIFHFKYLMFLFQKSFSRFGSKHDVDYFLVWMNQQYTTPRIIPVFPYLYVMNISVWNVFYADKYTILEVWKLSIKILGSKFLIIIH